jgi:hypothetical protein
VRNGVCFYRVIHAAPLGHLSEQDKLPPRVGNESTGRERLGRYRDAGGDYDTLFVEEMPGDQKLSKYSTLVFAQATLVDDATYSQIVIRLRAYLARNHGVILDGPFAIKDENEKEQ